MPANCTASGEIVQRTAALALFGRAEFSCDGGVAGGAFGLTTLGANSDAIARIIPLTGPSQTARPPPEAVTATIAEEPTR